MNNDQELQKNVLEAIRWEPFLVNDNIGVSAHDGVVTLTGTVNSYIKKTHSEFAAKSVAGVKAVIEELEVRFDTHDEKTDSEIADDVLKALKLNLVVPQEKIQVKVEDGWVTLDGEVQWNYQKEAAKEALQNLSGIKRLTNNILIKSDAADAVEKKTIEHALLRYSATSDQNIRIHVDGKTVTLNGSVQSFHQKDKAEQVVWNTPGVAEVHNELLIDLEN